MIRIASVLLGSLLLAACGAGETRPPATGDIEIAPPVPASWSAMHAEPPPVEGSTDAGPPAASSATIPPGWSLPAKRRGAFPGAELATVRAFEMEPIDASGKPECLKVLDERGALCRTVRGPGVLLTSSQVTKLLEILRAPATYGGGSKCFIPRHGFVFHDAAGVPIAEVALCFECEMIRGMPALLAGEEYSHGVSAEGLGGFRGLCKELGLGRCE